MNSSSQLPQHILIAGVGRSGTTILFRLIAQMAEESHLDYGFSYEPYLWNIPKWDTAVSDFEVKDFHHYGIQVHTHSPLFLDVAHPVHDPFIDWVLPVEKPVCAKLIRGNGRLVAWLRSRPHLKVICIVRNPVDTINSALNTFSLLGRDFHADDALRLPDQASQFFGKIYRFPEDELFPSEFRKSALYVQAMTDAAFQVRKMFPNQVRIIPYEWFQYNKLAFLEHWKEFSGLSYSEEVTSQVHELAGVITTQNNMPRMAVDFLAVQQKQYLRHIRLCDWVDEVNSIKEVYAPKKIRERFAPDQSYGKVLHWGTQKISVAWRDNLHSQNEAWITERAELKTQLQLAQTELKKLSHLNTDLYSRLAPFESEQARKNLKLTIAVCTYRRFDWLDQCLDSLRQQTLPQSEYAVIVVDNSLQPEQSLSFRDSLADFPNLEYVITEQSGLSFARNQALKRCQTPLIAFLDDDALACPKWASEVVSVFDRYPSAGVVGGKVLPIWEQEPPHWLSGELLHPLALLDWGDTPLFIEASKWLVGANIAYRTYALRKAGGFSTRLGRKEGLLLAHEELAVNLALQKQGYDLIYWPRARVEHLVQADRMSPEWFMRDAFFEGVSRVILETPDELTLSLQSNSSLENAFAESSLHTHSFSSTADIRSLCEMFREQGKQEARKCLEIGSCPGSQPVRRPWPVISILITCRNAGDSIDQTIRSVVAQTGSFAIRCHVLDFGSSDTTLEKIQAWEQCLSGEECSMVGCSNLVFWHSLGVENSPARLLEKGLRSLRTPDQGFITWLQAGEELAPNAIQTVYEAARHLDFSWIGGRIEHYPFAEDGKGHDGACYPVQLIQSGSCDGQHWPILPRAGCFFQQWLLDKVGGLNADLRYAALWDLWRRFSQYTEYIQVPTLFARVDAGQQKSSIFLEAAPWLTEEIEQIVSFSKRKAPVERLITTGPKEFFVPVLIWIESDHNFSVDHRVVKDLPSQARDLMIRHAEQLENIEEKLVLLGNVLELVHNSLKTVPSQAHRHILELEHDLSKKSHDMIEQLAQKEQETQEQLARKEQENEILKALLDEERYIWQKNPLRRFLKPFIPELRDRPTSHSHEKLEKNIVPEQRGCGLSGLEVTDPLSGQQIKSVHDSVRQPPKDWVPDSWQTVFERCRVAVGEFVDLIPSLEMLFKENFIPLKGPWIGFVHTPLQVPEELEHTRKIFPELEADIFTSNFWKKAQPSCRGLITFSSNYAKSLTHLAKVPVLDLQYPFPNSSWQWSAERFKKNEGFALVQWGWWLQRIHALYLIPDCPVQRVMLTTSSPAAKKAADRDREELISRGIFFDYMLEQISHHREFTGEQFPEHLNGQIAFFHYYAGIVPGEIIQCLSTQTPFFVNALPSIIEYLGTQYPLYYYSYHDVSKKLHDRALLLSAHEYLQELFTKKNSSIEGFVKEIVCFCKEKLQT